MDWPEEDDLWLLPAHLKESCSQTSKEDALKFLQAPPKVAFATQVALSRKLQRAIDKKAKKMTPSSTRNSLGSLPSVDEGNEDDMQRTCKKDFNSANLPVCTTPVLLSSVRSSLDNQTAMEVEETGEKPNYDSVIYTNFDEDEDFLFQERSILEEEESLNASFEVTSHFHENDFVSEPKVVELDFENLAAQNVLPVMKEPLEMSSNIDSHKKEDWIASNKSIEEPRSLSDFRNSLELHEMYYHPDKLDRDTSPPRMVDLEESSDEEFYDAEDDISDLNVALIESMKEMTVSSLHMDHLQMNEQPLVKNPSLGKVIEEAPLNRGLLGNHSPRIGDVDLGPINSKVHHQRSNSVSPRQVTTDHTLTLPSRKSPVDICQDKKMSMSVHSSLSTTPVARESRTMRGQKNPLLSARMPSAPPPRNTAVLKSQLSVNINPNSAITSGNSKSANVSPKISMAKSAAFHPSLHVDLADLQALAKHQEEELRKAVMGDSRDLGERKHSWQSEGNAPIQSRALHNSYYSSQQQISSSKSADISQLQRQSRAISTIGTTRLPPPRTVLPATIKKSGILAPGFGNKKITLGSLPARSVSAMSQPRHVVNDDECF